MSRSRAVLCLLGVLAGATPVPAQPAAPPVDRSLPDSPAVEPTDVPTEPGVPALPSFGSIFRALGGDFRRLPTWTNALWLGGTGALALSVHSEDASITRHAMNAQGLETALDGGAATGSGYVQVGLAVGLFVAGRFAGNGSTATLGSHLVQAQVVSAVLTQGLKFIVQRERPDGGSYSFPSGHTSATFATATVLEREFGWKVGVPAYVMAVYVGASRLSEDEHYLSDVIFGAGIGIVSARTVTIRHGPVAFALAPLVVPRGMGIGFTRVSP